MLLTPLVLEIHPASRLFWGKWNVLWMCNGSCSYFCHYARPSLAIDFKERASHHNMASKQYEMDSPKHCWPVLVRQLSNCKPAHSSHSSVFSQPMLVEEHECVAKAFSEYKQCACVEGYYFPNHQFPLLFLHPEPSFQNWVIFHVSDSGLWAGKELSDKTGKRWNPLPLSHHFIAIVLLSPLHSHFEPWQQWFPNYVMWCPQAQQQTHRGIVGCHW